MQIIPNLLCTSGDEEKQALEKLLYRKNESTYSSHIWITRDQGPSKSVDFSKPV